MDTAPVHHKRKVEPPVKPISHIDKVQDLHRRKDQQHQHKDNRKKEKPFYDVNHPPDGYA